MKQTRHVSLGAAFVAVSLFCCHATRAAAGQTTQHSTATRCPPLETIRIALGQASSLMAHAQFKDAAAALKPLADSSCDPRASLLYAAALEGQGDTVTATAVLEHAHTHWPSNNSVAASLAHEYMSAHKPEKAAVALKHFAAKPTTPQQELEEAVLVDFATHQLPQAQSVAALDWKTYPSLHTLLLLANALQLEGRYPDVNRLLAPKRDSYADSPDFFITLAESESDAAVYRDAIEDLNRAIALDPRSPLAHYLLGYVKLHMNDSDGAVTELRASIDLGSTQPRTYYQLALALRNKQDDAGEMQALDQALSVDDHYSPAQCELGRILLDQHKAGDAVPHLLQAIQYNPRSEDGYFLLSRAYASLGNKGKSQEMVKRLVEIRKQNRATAQNKPLPLSEEN